MGLKLADVGEREIIGRIRQQYGYPWPDEDSSMIDTGKDYLLITTDSISKGSHMPKGADMESIGHFFAALNLSDIAAMGGTPRYFMTALTFPRSMELKDLIGIERGIRKCLDKYKVKLIGGDLKQGRELNMTGIAIGSVRKKEILRRSGAKTGDILCMTGSLGKNAAGYYMWKKTGLSRWAELLIEIEPRIKEGRLIAQCGASSAIDLSDGIFSAIRQLNKITGKGFEIHCEKVPIHETALAVSKKLKIGIEKIAFDFGGEYELLFTVSKHGFKKIQQLAKKRGIQISAIGRVHGKANTLIKAGGKIRISGKGYEHFAKN